jgi:hypothetical protein
MMNARTEPDTAPAQPAGQQRASVRQIYDQTRRVGNELGALADAARQALEGCRALARERLEEQPYATLAVAAGIGYVLGGGVPTTVMRLVFGVGSRLAVERALAQLAAPAASPRI